MTGENKWWNDGWKQQRWNIWWNTTDYSTSETTGEMTSENNKAEISGETQQTIRPVKTNDEMTDEGQVRCRITFQMAYKLIWCLDVHIDIHKFLVRVLYIYSI